MNWPLHKIARLSTFTAALCFLLTVRFVAAQAPLGAGEPAWLAYKPVDAAAVFPSGTPDTITELGQNVLEDSATHELALGWRGMLQHEPRVMHGSRGEVAQGVIIGTQAEVETWQGSMKVAEPLAPDTYKIFRQGKVLVVEGGGARGTLYGAFALLRDIAEQHPLTNLHETSTPWASIRWTNEWDNPNGTIERGYAGPSIFFEGGKVRTDLSRAAAYARLLGSVGIDGCTINNVNADINLLRPENLKI